MSDVHSVEQAQEQAALYSVGAMPAEDAVRFEEHLRRGCDACERELRSFRAVAGDLGLSADAARPGSGVRAAVLERFAERIVERDGVRFVRAGRIPWAATRLAAVETKPLFRDPGRGYATQLVRLLPGAAYPPHRHAEAEEIYVLEGDLNVSGVEMFAGDYCRAEPGTVHEGVRTRDGCVFLVLSSERDEILA